MWHSGRQTSRLSGQTKPDSLFKPALLRSETSTASEAFVGEYIYVAYVAFK
jgi:hypothetical protein